MRAGAVESRAHRADQLERLGHALIRELLPREQQQRLALVVRQRLDRVGHAREHARRAAARVARLSVASSAAIRAFAQPPRLAAPVLQQQVGPDSVEPRQRARAELSNVLRRSNAIRNSSPTSPSATLRRPAAEEAQQRGRVAVVDQPEDLGSPSER